jgi:hypothetical protein
MSNAHNRKDFIKKLGLTLTGAAASVSGFGNYQNDADLIDEQKEFLTEYEDWLSEFQSYISMRNRNPLDTTNNKRLMELSAESQHRKSRLELYMKDPKFASFFNSITKNISESI